MLVHAPLKVWYTWLTGGMPWESSRTGSLVLKKEDHFRIPRKPIDLEFGEELAPECPKKTVELEFGGCRWLQNPQKTH